MFAIQGAVSNARWSQDISTPGLVVGLTSKEGLRINQGAHAGHGRLAKMTDRIFTLMLERLGT